MRRLIRRAAQLFLALGALGSAAATLGCATRPARFPTLSAPPEARRSTGAREDDLDDSLDEAASERALSTRASATSESTTSSSARLPTSHQTALELALHFRLLLEDTERDVERVLAEDAKLSGFDGTRGRPLRNVLRDRRSDLRPTTRGATGELFAELIVEAPGDAKSVGMAEKSPQTTAETEDVVVRVRPLVGGGARDGLRQSWFVRVRSTKSGARVVEVRTHDGLLPER